MTERPIIFSGDMVRAILDGTKTQTRRVVKPEPTDYGLEWIETPEGFAAWVDWGLTLDEGQQRLCPYGVTGDRLWVRETWGAVWPDVDRDYVPLEECNIEYRADLPPGCTDYPGQWPAEEARGDPDAPKWRPSIHMPRWASRIMLEITGVHVERVQDISFDDAIAEGVCVDAHGMRSECRNWFCALWNSINAKRGYGWDANPWVWVIEFRRVSP